MPGDPIRLYGTDEVPVAPRRLTAGPLEALLDGGGLRAVRYRGLEVLRALVFLVRTEGWGTSAPALSDLRVEVTPGRFEVSYRAEVRDRGAVLRYRVELLGEAGGRLEARAIIQPVTDFPTNRTGFVVLHPLQGVAGQPVEVVRVDGRVEAATLPADISPAQPLRDLRAITHCPAPGLSATVRLEGDTFEMEDQRNWSDASFKTYSRPLALPFPYVLAAGSTSRQAVTLTVAGEPGGGAGPVSARTAAVGVRLGRPSGGVLPRIGLAVPAELAAASAEVGGILRDAAPSLLLAHHDLSQGHGRPELRAHRALAEATRVPVTLEILLPGVDRPAEELGCVAADAGAVGLRPAAVAVFPRVDLRSFQPGQARPPGPTLADIYAAARSAFPGLRLGGGTPAFFTELNRQHPPAALLDYVTHGTCPIVHAADDAAVMETLETLPWIATSARRIAGAAAYHVGPVAIGARNNPYGAAPSANPDNRRVGLAELDPRQRGLFGAAWYLGYAAAVAPHGVEELVLAATIGPFGIAWVPQPFAQPWYDERATAAVFPAFHVLSDLAAAAGRPRLEVEVSAPARIAALAWLAGGAPRLALANLTAGPLVVRLEGWGWGPLHGRVLDEATFERAALDWRGFRRDLGPLGANGELLLSAHAVALLGGAP